MLRRMFVIVSLGWMVSWFAAPPLGAQDADSLTPVPAQQGVAALTPANTMIQFIGVHAGAEPNPRIGHFQDFTGQARLDSSGATVEAITVEIQTNSLTTLFPNLTNHLKSPDFLDVREYPTAKFQTTRIAPLGEKNQFEVTGELTLHGNTVPLVFPAIIEVQNSGVTLQADLTIDRTEFGMDLLTDRVVKDVDLNLAIGRSAPTEGQDNAARQPFNPKEFFRQRDANGDGKLSGDELTQRMRDSIADFDTDNDGAISESEFEARVQAFSGSQGGRGRERRRSGNE